MRGRDQIETSAQRRRAAEGTSREKGLGRTTRRHKKETADGGGRLQQCTRQGRRASKTQAEHSGAPSGRAQDCPRQSWRQGWPQGRYPAVSHGAPARGGDVAARSGERRREGPPTASPSLRPLPRTTLPRQTGRQAAAAAALARKNTQAENVRRLDDMSARGCMSQSKAGSQCALQWPRLSQMAHGMKPSAISSQRSSRKATLLERTKYPKHRRRWASALLVPIGDGAPPSPPEAVGTPLATAAAAACSFSFTSTNILRRVIWAASCR